METTTENINDNSIRFAKIAEQLKLNSKVYDNDLTKDIFMGCQEVSTLISGLSKMYLIKEYGQSEISDLKAMIYMELKNTINDFQNHFASYPDEITETNIREARELLEQFNVL